MRLLCSTAYNPLSPRKAMSSSDLFDYGVNIGESNVIQYLSIWMEGMDSNLFKYRGRLTLILSSYSVSTFREPDVVHTKSH